VGTDSGAKSSLRSVESKFCRIPVCGVAVTYHPSKAMIQHLRTVRTEVQALVVVDNGSNSNEVEMLKASGAELDFCVIQNAGNFGIAKALNQGVAWAKHRGFEWVLLLDQDSRMSEGFTEAMFQVWTLHPQRDRLATVHPRYMHPELGVRPLAPRARDGSYMWCMTSGALMPMWVFEKIGYFASEFFIDWVDIEYCFRIRKAGYLLAEASGAVLIHDPGQSAPAYFLGRKFWPSHHSAVRRYYMSRNRIVVFRKYFVRLPVWTMRAMYAALRDTAKCFLGERDRGRKLRNFLLGTWDGLTGKMGQRVDL